MTRRRFIGLFITVSLVLGFGFVLLEAPTHTSAASAVGFNPGHIIDDSMFYAAGSMTSGQVQTFLNSKVPSCSSGYTCLKDYSQVTTNEPAESGICSYLPASNNDPTHFWSSAQPSAAEIITNVANACGISPKVMIVLLQKEMGLITSTAPTSYNYNYATGYGCPDTTGCQAQYYGFFNQVYNAAKQFQRYRADPTNWNYVAGQNNQIYYNPGPCETWSNGSCTQYYGSAGSPAGSQPDITYCGSSWVYIQNQATAGLYDYTPYQPNQAALNAGYGTGDTCSTYGNRNFYLYYTDWFGPTTGTVLLQSPESPTVYLQSGNTRYGVPSYNTLQAYGLGNTKVTPVTDGFMNSLTNGGVLSTTFTVAGDGTVYLADNGYYFGFATQQECVDWGFPNCLSSSSSMVLQPYLINLLHSGGVLRTLMLHGTGIYLMQSGYQRLFLTYQALTENGYSSNDVTPITNQLNSSQPAGNSLIANNSFVKFGTNPAVYIYNAGSFYILPSYDTFLSITPPNTTVLHDTTSLYATSPPQNPISISPYISVGGKDFVLSGGNKYDITGIASDWPATQDLSALSGIINAVPTTSTIDANSSFRQPNGLLFRVVSKTITPFYSVPDFFKSPFNKTPLPVAYATQGLPIGSTYITPGMGTVYQSNDPNKKAMIYIRNTDGTNCALSGLNQLADFSLDTSDVQRISDTTAPGGSLWSLVKDQNGNYYIVDRGTELPISPTDRSNWGIGNPASCSLDEQFIGQLPVTQASKTFTFAQLPSGAIFYAQDGSAHLVSTYSKFLALGGNANNTVAVPGDFFNYATLGQPIN